MLVEHRPYETIGLAPTPIADPPKFNALSDAPTDRNHAGLMLEAAQKRDMSVKSTLTETLIDISEVREDQSNLLLKYDGGGAPTIDHGTGYIFAAM